MKMLSSFGGAIKNSFLIILAAALIASFVYTKKLQSDREGVIDLYEQQVQINDSTQAKLAQTELARKELQSLRDAAKDMGGDVVAGVKITVPAETVYVETKKVATVDSGGTRYAVLEDSTESYKIKINAVAPPYPDSLQIGYEFTTPEFSPEIGFVRIKDKYVTVVSWGGKDITIESPYFQPSKDPRLQLDAWIRTAVDRDAVPTAGLSLRTNIKSLQVSVGYSSRQTFEVELSKSLWTLK